MAVVAVVAVGGEVGEVGREVGRETGVVGGETGGEVGVVGVVGVVSVLIDELKRRGVRNESRFAHWIVVGNGPLGDADRSLIEKGAKDSIVVRFNDENNFVAGDPVDVHVVRHPSWGGRKNGIVDWHVAPFRAWVPIGSTVTSIVFENQYAGQSDASSNQVLFASTCNSSDCWTNRTKYGASTGAIVISALSESTLVKNISVFGMNWHGAPDHLDFLHPTLISDFCLKCTIHKTHSSNYGQSGTLFALAMLGTISIFGCFLFMYLSEIEVASMYRYFVVETSRKSESEGSGSRSERSGESGESGESGSDDLQPPPPLPLLPG
jgi:hypothetical protein